MHNLLPSFFRTNTIAYRETLSRITPSLVKSSKMTANFNLSACAKAARESWLVAYALSVLSFSEHFPANLPSCLSDIRLGIKPLNLLLSCTEHLRIFKFGSLSDWSVQSICKICLAKLSVLTDKSVSFRVTSNTRSIDFHYLIGCTIKSLPSSAAPLIISSGITKNLILTSMLFILTHLSKILNILINRELLKPLNQKSSFVTG